ncbi:MAG: riboflavin biosynthesis protein RibF [Bacteroides sp.]|nr:riboflavin biosynthesis protein RibF [Bacteroides sp.]
MTDITAKGCKNGKSAVALGFFDGLHLGHIEVIKQALLRTDLLSVVFTFNDKTMLPKFKERENIIAYDLKLELLSRIGADHIFAPDFADMRDLSAEEFAEKILVEKLNAGFVACGYDFRFAKGGAATAEQLAEICRGKGIEVCVVPAVTYEGEPISATAIRALIRDGNVEKANKLLGYELTYVLEVRKGKKNGRKMGFPTINQLIPEGMIVPKRGVYKSWTQVRNRNYPSITNIGLKPTIALDSGEDRVTEMETHIIGYSGDLYGLRTRVVLREYMREERKFDSMEELRLQLEKDKERAVKKN